LEGKSNVYFICNDFFFISGLGCVYYITDVVEVIILCSFAYSHRNLFGRNQKLNVSLERGQIDSIFRINYTDPWIEGDDKRTSRSIMVQVTPLLVISMRLLR
jgi:hypothetical protein